MLLERGPSRVSPFVVPMMIVDLAAGHVSIRYNLKGINYAPVSACATGSHAIGEAFEVIRRGDADVIVCGGFDAGVTPLGVAGFAAARALSTRNDDPQGASRPWDAGRDGFVIAEGGGVLVLEDWDHAVARGAHIRAELVGYGATADAYHITAPAPDGNGAIRAMRQALAQAGLEPADIDYINAHGTSTDVGDLAETNAIKAVFGADAPLVELDQVDDGPHARRRGRRRGGRLRARDGARARPADDQPHRSRPGVRPRLRAQRRAQGRARGHDEQLVRLRRAQRDAHLREAVGSDHAAQARSSTPIERNDEARIALAEKILGHASPTASSFDARSRTPRRSRTVRSRASTSGSSSSAIRSSDSSSPRRSSGASRTCAKAA